MLWARMELLLLALPEEADGLHGFIVEADGLVRFAEHAVVDLFERMHVALLGFPDERVDDGTLLREDTPYQLFLEDKRFLGVSGDRPFRSAGAIPLSAVFHVRWKIS